MSDIKIFIAIITVFTVLVISAFIPRITPQTSGIFPQVVSCVNQNPDDPASDPHWQPTLRVKIESVRDPGRVREYRVLGCRLYYYTSVTSDDPRRGLFTGVRGEWAF
jgi:hypothetical protein